jgi:hypothetical protein
MKRFANGLIMMCAALGLVGCRAEVKETPNSVKIETELPKIEVNKTPDLDPRTDDDVDVKTPATTDTN